MHCTHCGNKNNVDSKFCTKCGNRLNPSGSNRTEDILFVPEKKSHTLRNILLVIVVIGALLFLFAAIFSSDDTITSNSSTKDLSNWQTFTSVEHNFMVDFPTYPESERSSEETTDDIAYSYTQYSSEDSDSTYLAQAADYDIRPSEYDNKAGLEGMVNGIIGTDDDYQLTSSYFTTHNGYDAIDFTFTYKGGEYYGKGAAIIRDDLSTIKAYLLMMMSKYSDVSKYDKFINSFSIN